MAELGSLVDPAALARLRAAAGPRDSATPAPTEPDEPVEASAADQPVEHKAADGEPGALEHKSDLPGTQVLSTDEETGVVEALVSVTGIEDRVKDIIEPGAYTKTMAKREPIGVWSHDDKTWVARKEEAVELLPGDPFFKGLTLNNGEPWPAEAGAVKVRARFNLDTPHGRAAFSDVNFFKDVTSWSIGYRATKHHRNPRTGVRHIKELDWFEFSPVMVGAAAQAMTLSVKSLAQPVDADDPSGIVDEGTLAALDADELDRYLELKGDLERADDDGLEVKAGGGQPRRVRTPEGARRFGAPIGSVIVRDAAGNTRVLSTPDKPAPRRPARGGGSSAASGSPGDVLGDRASWARGDSGLPTKKVDGYELRDTTRGAGQPTIGVLDADGRSVGRLEQMQMGPDKGKWQANTTRARLGKFDSSGEALAAIARNDPSNRERAADAAAAKATSDREKLAALNRRRKKAGKPLLLVLPPEVKALDDLELAGLTDAEVGAFSDAKAVGELTDDELSALLMADVPMQSSFVDAAIADADLEGKGSRASLDRSPRSNWVEEAGGLPPYIREVARAIERDTPGMTLEGAIPRAIGRIKKWARGGGNVTAATRAKAVAAIAAWEALKARSGKKFDSELLAELERKAMPAFIKDKIEAREDGGDDDEDPKRQPHKYVAPSAGGGLCKKCMAPKGAKVHTDTADDEKALALLLSYKALGDVLVRVGALPETAVVDELDDPDLEEPAELEGKGLTLDELERADDLRAAVAVDDIADLLARRAALESKAKPEGYATVKERVAAARGYDEGVADAKGKGGEKGGAKKGRKVRTEAGAARYGKPIGEFYTKEKGEGPVERGESGERTRAAQKALVAAGLLDPKDGTDGKAEDGFFGPKTEAAIKKWQKENGLEATGVLDEETERMLVKAKLRPDSGDGDGDTPAAARGLPKVPGGGVDVESATDEQVAALQAAGWKGKPGDGREAMYPPAAAAPKKATPKAGGGGGVEAIRAQLAAMPAADRERLAERARQVVAALAAL